jgi:bifunctional DNA-binding transcriptional regulator/antitoxin component of YhaV-PrlF toxin-antitoxin module
MNKVATFKAKYLKDGHLSIPKEVVASLLLRRGEEVRVVIEKENLDKKGSLSLFGIWRDKSEEEIHLYREIVKERKIFGRGEIEL